MPDPVSTMLRAPAEPAPLPPSLGWRGPPLRGPARGSWPGTSLKLVASSEMLRSKLRRPWILEWSTCASGDLLNCAYGPGQIGCERIEGEEEIGDRSSGGRMHACSRGDRPGGPGAWLMISRHDAEPVSSILWTWCAPLAPPVDPNAAKQRTYLAELALPAIKSSSSLQEQNTEISIWWTCFGSYKSNTDWRTS